jgi:penicillin-binding protein 2
MKDRLIDRYNILTVIFLLLAVVIILQLVNLQVIHGVEYDAKSQLILNERKILAPRGNIEDRNGVPIATNRMGFLVQIAYSEQLNTDELNSMLSNLIKIFEKNKDSYYKSLGRYLTFDPIGYGPWVSGAKSPIKSLKTGLGIDMYKDAAALKTPQEVFNYLRKTRYKIDPKYSDSEAYKIMCIRFEARTYTSLNSVPIAKDVSKVTVVSGSNH